MTNKIGTSLLLSAGLLIGISAASYEAPLESVSVQASSLSSYIVKSGDTAYRIAINNGLTLALLQEYNEGVDLNKLKIGQILALESPILDVGFATKKYTIAKGETFNRVALKTGTPSHLMTSLNPSVDPSKLKIGQKINVAATIQDNAKVHLHILKVEPAKKRALVKDTIGGSNFWLYYFEGAEPVLVEKAKMSNNIATVAMKTNSRNATKIATIISPVIQ